MDKQRPQLQEVSRLPRPAPGRWWRRFRPSPVWLVPLLAVVVVTWLALHAWLSRGPAITIRFATADGLVAGTTPVKVRNVDVGRVTGVALLPDRSGVAATVQLERASADLLGEGARFWVVRPRVSPAGVSGLDTLLGGVHVAMDPAARPGPVRTFLGLDAPPATMAGRRGRRFVLRAESIGSLEVGSPVYRRRFQVGQVTRTGLDPAGDQVELEIFVDAPHDRQVTADTRFWNASGVDLTVNARGIKVDTQSLVSVLRGGVALQTPPGADGPPAAEGARFQLFDGEASALRQPGGRAQPHRLVFRRPVRGLEPGAVVDLLGQPIGEVARVELELDPDTAAPRSVVDVNLFLDRLRPAGAPAGDPAAGRLLLGKLVQQGLRAQTRPENLLTGERRVSFDLVPGARPVLLRAGEQPPELPTFEGPGDDLPEAIGRLVARLEAVPLDELAREGTLAARQMRRTFEGTAALATQLERSLSTGAPLQQDLRRTLRDLGGAGYALRSLAEYLERHPESLVRGKHKDRR